MTTLRPAQAKKTGAPSGAPALGPCNVLLRVRRSRRRLPTRAAATTASTARRRRPDPGAAPHELHRLRGRSSRRLLLDERNPVRDPLGFRRSLEIMVVELVHAHFDVVLVVVAGEAVPLAFIRQEDHRLLEESKRVV